MGPPISFYHSVRRRLTPVSLGGGLVPLRLAAVELLRRAPDDFPMCSCREFGHAGIEPYGCHHCRGGEATDDCPHCEGGDIKCRHCVDGWVGAVDPENPLRGLSPSVASEAVRLAALLVLPIWEEWVRAVEHKDPTTWPWNLPRERLDRARGVWLREPYGAPGFGARCAWLAAAWWKDGYGHRQHERALEHAESAWVAAGYSGFYPTWWSVCRAHLPVARPTSDEILPQERGVPRLRKATR